MRFFLSHHFFLYGLVVRLLQGLLLEAQRGVHVAGLFGIKHLLQLLPQRG